jgi:RHS repeat-associated protein
LVQTYRTDAFGAPTATQGSSTQPFGFTGEQADSTGLVYLRARMYDPTIGRFVQRDPLTGSIPSPGTLNRYTYVINNPALFVDHSGLSPFESQHLEDDKNCFDPNQLFCVFPRVNCQAVLGCIVFAEPAKNFDPSGGSAGAGAARTEGRTASAIRVFATGSLEGHFEKHGAEFGFQTAAEYLRGAQKLTEGGPGIETFIRANGDTLFYKTTTNEFAVLRPNNIIRTYFKPIEGFDYWLGQINVRL